MDFLMSKEYAWWLLIVGFYTGFTFHSLILLIAYKLKIVEYKGLAKEKI